MSTKGRVILQDLETHSYLAGDSSWASSCQQAKVFEHTYVALLEGLNYHPKALQVVWCFRNPSMNMYLPVNPADGARVVACDFCPLTQRAA